MNPEFAIEMIKGLMLQAVTLATPILVTAMAIGLCVSIFQAVTAIQEQTLAFVPKALSVIAIITLLLPWIIRSIVEFSISVIQRIPDMVR